jgi:hypothetical protein
MDGLKKFLMVLFLGLILFSGIWAQNQANVLLDTAMTTWSAFAPGVQDMLQMYRNQNGSRVPIIAWHPTSDPFGTTFSQYWCTTAFPNGYNAVQVDHVGDTSKFASRLALSRPLFMEADVHESTAQITIRNDSATDIQANILAVIVERNICYNWQTKTTLDFVARLNCFSDDTGETICIPAGQTISKTVNYDLSKINYPSGASPAVGGAQFELAAFVYNPDTLEVLQAAPSCPVEKDCSLSCQISYKHLSGYTYQFFCIVFDSLNHSYVITWTLPGGISHDPNPIVTFPGPGNYPISISVTCSGGNTCGMAMGIDIPPMEHRESLIGVFSDGLWKLDKTESGLDWTKLSLQRPDMIRMGDVDGNGLDDLGCWFKTTQKFWIRYDNGTWVDVPASAKDMICFDLGDINKDGYADIVGSWTFGTWWKNTASGVWAKLSNMSPSYLAAGDVDGDGYWDMVGLYPTLSSLWIYQYNGAKWTKISKQIDLNDLRSGDFDNDGKAEVLGSWNIGTWTFNPTTNSWVKHSNNRASVLCAGDINGGNKDDIAGDWSPANPGLWIKTLEDNTWTKHSNQAPADLTSGKTQ